MKLLHISDLHIGKRVKGFSLIEDQKAILRQIIDTIVEENIDAVLIAGDIYDVSNPSNEAVSLFDKFITEINGLNKVVLAVSGNHDSIYRVSFGSSIMAKQNVRFAKKYSGNIEKIALGEGVNVWLLPFIRPVDVREFHPDFKEGSYEDMIKAVLSNISLNKDEVNILLAHQFITNSGHEPERSESESFSLGTLENIDASNFKDFDYCALGHIHKPQEIIQSKVIYSGSPIKYSFSEKDDKKAMIILEILNKNIEIKKIPYKPIKDMVEFRGNFEDLMNMPKCKDYARLILTDEDFILDAKNRLNTVYENIMEITYDNSYTKETSKTKLTDKIEHKTPIELFETFFEQQNNKNLSDEQKEIVKEIFEEISEGAIEGSRL